MKVLPDLHLRLSIELVDLVFDQLFEAEAFAPLDVYACQEHNIVYQPLAGRPVDRMNAIAIFDAISFARLMSRISERNR